MFNFLAAMVQVTLQIVQLKRLLTATSNTNDMEGLCSPQNDTTDNTATERMRIDAIYWEYGGCVSRNSPFHVKNSVNTVARFESTDSVSRIVLKDNSGEIRVGATLTTSLFILRQVKLSGRVSTMQNMEKIGESSPAQLRFRRR